MLQRVKLLLLMLTAGECHNLTFLFITSFGEFGFNSSGAVPGVDVALEGIRNRSDILPGYSLVYNKVRDSKCDRGNSLDAFFDEIAFDPVKLFIVGCGCSVASEPVAEISHRWNISQISYGSSSSELSNRVRFKGYFRTSVTHEILPPAFRAIIQHFNWNRIVLFTLSEGLFEAIESNFRKELESVNITVESPTFKLNEGATKSAIKFFDEKKDFHIFFINAYSSAAREIFCEAYKRKLTYPRYVWIVFDWYPQKWWTEQVANNQVDCTDSQLEEFLERVLSLREDPAIDFEAGPTDTGISPATYQMQYEKRASDGGYSIEDVGAYAYDAVWAMAFALNATMSMINSQDISNTGCENASGMLVPLEEFNYTNKKLGCLIQFHLQNTNFTGVSGPIRFDDNGTREHGIILLKQYQRQNKRQLIRRNIAIVEERLNYTFLYEPEMDTSTVYPDGTPPDGTPHEITNTFSIGLVVTLDVLAAFGIAFAIGCLVFNFKFRNKWMVKRSSPNLNYFIITGALIMYSSVYFYLIPSTDKTVVQARCVLDHWLFTIGYSFVYGAILAKMWRIFKIFHNPTPKKKLLKDHNMVIITLVIVGISALMLILETAIPQLRGGVISKPDQEYPPAKTSLGVRKEFFVLVCYETLSPTFFWRTLIFVYLAVLQVIGILLAFLTRKVKVKGLRDSKFIAAIVYISSIVLVVLALVNFSLRLFINTGTGIFVISILTLTTLILALAFVPKMVMIYTEEDETSPSFASTSIQMTEMQNDSGWQEKIALLQKSLDKKEKLIAELRNENDILKQSQENTSKQSDYHECGDHSNSM